MGDKKSMKGKNPYCWFNKNINKLAGFLDVQLQSADVKEVVILGDLFDEWIIPANAIPLTSYDDICSNPANKPIIDKLIALAASPDIKLSYVPGNHDMSMNIDGIATTKLFLEKQFPGIRYFSKNDVPLGSYNVGTIAAEHGDRYCLFNAPDTWTAQGTFIPIGYFISRMVAYKVATTGKSEDYRVIIEKFINKFRKHPGLAENLLLAIAFDAGLTPDSNFDMTGIPGFENKTSTLKDIITRFRNLTSGWEKTSGNIDLFTAIFSDAGNLSFAASSAYFSQVHSNINIVIFGHTHSSTMDKRLTREPDLANNELEDDIPSIRIYANSGSWVDSKKCTYVETEEIVASKRHYVRVKNYPSNTIIYEGFVEM
jgi:UDP-2,3-diacylglucosamine pyrophosphatase LpxH